MSNRKPRSAKPRFSAGDNVEVTKAIRYHRFQGATGAVINVKENQHAVSLDKYVIHFAEGGDEVFWDIELAARSNG